MTNNRGFTLIELVIVIVILGIISAVALPKFINLSSDAKNSVLQNLAGTIRSVAEQTKLKAAILGVEKNERSAASNPPAVIINEISMELKYGYPEAYADNANAGDLLDLLTIGDELEVCYSGSCVSGNSSRVKIGFDTTEDTGCYVQYSEPGGTGAPSDKEYGLKLVNIGC